MSSSSRMSLKKCPLCCTYHSNMASHKRSLGHLSMIKAIKSYISNVTVPGRDELISDLDLSEE